MKFDSLKWSSDCGRPLTEWTGATSAAWSFLYLTQSGIAAHQRHTKDLKYIEHGNLHISDDVSFLLKMKSSVSRHFCLLFLEKDGEVPLSTL